MTKTKTNEKTVNDHQNMIVVNLWEEDGKLLMSTENCKVPVLVRLDSALEGCAVSGIVYPDEVEELADMEDPK